MCPFSGFERLAKPRGRTGWQPVKRAGLPIRPTVGPLERSLLRGTRSKRGPIVGRVGNPSREPDCQSGLRSARFRGTRSKRGRTVGRVDKPAKRVGLATRWPPGWGTDRAYLAGPVRRRAPHARAGREDTPYPCLCPSSAIVSSSHSAGPAKSPSLCAYTAICALSSTGLRRSPVPVSSARAFLLRPLASLPVRPLRLWPSATRTSPCTKRPAAISFCFAVTSPFTSFMVARTNDFLA